MFPSFQRFVVRAVAVVLLAGGLASSLQAQMYSPYYQMSPYYGSQAANVLSLLPDVALLQ